MKAKDLAALLLLTPDMDVVYNDFEYGKTDISNISYAKWNGVYFKTEKELELLKVSDKAFTLATEYDDLNFSILLNE